MFVGCEEGREQVEYCFRMVFWIGCIPTQVLDFLLIQEEVQGTSNSAYCLWLLGMSSCVHCQGTTVCLDLLPALNSDQPGWQLDYLHPYT